MSTNTTDHRDGKPRVHSRRSPLVNRTVVGMLRSPARCLVQSKMCVIRYTAASTGESVEFPVQYARSGDAVIVVAAKPETKSWWRHFTSPAEARVQLEDRWVTGVGRTLTGQERVAALADYQAVYPRIRLSDAVPVVAFAVRPADRPTEERMPDIARAWIPSVTIAEFLGFSVPAGVGVATAASSPVVTLPALVAAGAVEGAFLGWGQVRVLQRALPAISRARWIAATAAAAAFAYFVGMGPSTWASPITDWPPAAVVGVMSILGIAVLFSIGTAQWLVLRRHVPKATPWIAITALAWFVGLAVFLAFAMPLWQEDQSTALRVAIGVGGGFLMAATTSVLTAGGLRCVLPRSRSAERE